MSKKLIPYRNRRRYLIIILVLILILLCFFKYSDTVSFIGNLISKRWNNNYKPFPCDCDNNNIPCKINGICLHYNYDYRLFFPKEMNLWRGVQFDLNYVKEAFYNIEGFTKNYNPDFLKSNLTDIFIVKELKCAGKNAGGAHYNSTIYIAYDLNYPEMPVQAIMHAELSSILMKKYSFPEQEWRLINKKDFRYSNNVLEVLGKEETNRLLLDSLEGGFVTEYAKTTLENDFNMIVEMLFYKKDYLCTLRRRYERIDKKAEMAIQFYESIGSGATFEDCKIFK